jgi:hypothetical protein
VQVVQQPPASADQDQQAAPRVVVLLVLAQVLRELVDAEGHERDLHLCRAGVGLGAAELGRELALALFGQWHEASLVGFLRALQPGRRQGMPTPAGNGDACSVAGLSPSAAAADTSLRAVSEIAQPQVPRARRRRLPLLAAAGIVAALVAVSPHLSGVAGDHPEPQHAVAVSPKPVPPPPLHLETVYELSAVAPGGVDAGRAWIAPAIRSWRVQEGSTSAVVHGTSLESTGSSGTYLRRGLTRAFLGDRAHLTVADAIGLYAAGRRRGVVSGHTLELSGQQAVKVRLDGHPFLTLRVVRTLARAEELFAIDPHDVDTSDVELRPGAAPGVPVRAYWLGRATTAFEHRGARPQDVSVTVRSGALQVRSEPVGSSQAASDLALYRTWTPRRIRLADGTRARLYTFKGGLAVLAGNTLVTLLGPARPADVARLRALPAPLAPAGPGTR